jgi:hypothetical protein
VLDITSQQPRPNPKVASNYTLQRHSEVILHIVLVDLRVDKIAGVVKIVMNLWGGERRELATVTVNAKASYNTGRLCVTNQSSCQMSRLISTPLRIFNRQERRANTTAIVDPCAELDITHEAEVSK